MMKYGIWIRISVFRQKSGLPQVVLNAKLLHPLQGVDTMLVTSGFTGLPVTWALGEEGGERVYWAHKI